MSLFTLCTVELCPHKDCYINKAAAMSYDFQTLENTHTKNIEKKQALNLTDKFLMASEWRKLLLQCGLEYSESYIHGSGLCVEHH